MGGFYSRNMKDFQSVTPYPTSGIDDEGMARKKSKIDLGDTRNNSEIKKITPLGPKREPSLGPSWVVNVDKFNFEYTEGQHRRDLMANCEDQCSEITDFLYVSGAKVAGSRDILRKHDITRVINLAPSVVENFFIHEPEFTYLVIDMLDGRQDDISWFLCEVIRFIEVGRHGRYKTLLHCEKGISRSCSYAIAYLMWASGSASLLSSCPHLSLEYSWKASLDYVINCRAACAPNTSFTCNLIEIDDLLNGESHNIPIFYRLASHRSGDLETPVLKLIRSPDTRKILLPRNTLLNSYGIYVIRPANSHCKVLYVWKGRYADSHSLKIACMLAEQMIGILSDADTIEVIDDISEPASFRDHIIQEGSSSRSIQQDYDDLFKGTKETLEMVTRRHIICGMLKEKVPSQTTVSSQPILLVDSHDGDFHRSSTFSAHDTESGEIRGEELTETSEPSRRQHPQSSSPHLSPTNSQKFSLVLKHNLQVHSSRSAIVVERPLLRNLTSTNIDEGDQRFSSRIDYESNFLVGQPPLVRIGSMTASFGESPRQSFSTRNNQHTTESVIHDTPIHTRRTNDSFSPVKSSSLKPLKPMLFQCMPIEDYDRSTDRKLWEWQRLKVYDDDDLGDVSSPFSLLLDSLHSRPFYFSGIQHPIILFGLEAIGNHLMVITMTTCSPSKYI